MNHRSAPHKLSPPNKRCGVQGCRVSRRGRNSTASAVVSFVDEDTSGAHPEDFRFSGTQAVSIAKFYEVVTGAPAPVVDTPFTDLPADSLAADDIARIWGLGITTGATPSTLAPAENVTREQMASFLARLYRVLTEQPQPAPPTHCSTL